MFVIVAMLIVTIVVLLVVIGLTATITVYVTKKESITNTLEKNPRSLYTPLHLFRNLYQYR